MKPLNPILNKPSDRVLLKSTSLFDGLNSEEMEAFEKLIVRKHFSRDDIVLFEEDNSNYMYIVYSGKVRVVQFSSKGKERIIAIHKRGDYFGEIALLDGKTAPATVIAMEESDIGLLSKSNFEKFFLKNDKILFQFIAMLCSRLRESWLMLKIMSFADAEERVRAVLKNMGKLYGVKDQRGMLVALKLTHKDIANYASVSRETVTRLMNKFSEEGEIEIQDNRYILIKSSFSKKQLLL